MDASFANWWWALGGAAAGAVVCWLWMRSVVATARVTAAADAQARQAVAVERASRVPALEQQVREALAQAASAQGESTRLSIECAERGQQLAAAEDRLREADATAARLQAEARTLAADLQSVKEARAALEEKVSRIPVLEQQLAESVAAAEAALANASRAKEELAEMRATLDAERQQIPQQLARLEEARAELSNHFKALAAEILDEKGKSFAELNQNTLGPLLNPLRERMNEFKTKVEEIHAKDLEQQATLKAELAQLKELNKQITEEAHGLAVALKGQSKMQGNWGELVLGNVLDRAGLCEGKDYRREVSFDTEEGRRRPDVVLSLPQNKHLVIDAKVSLNAYTRYVNADEPGARELALREHVSAIASRIQELADRKYFDLPGLNTPEMVFMFIPIESAFVEALRADESLFQRAIERNILVATPTTLLTSLNIVRQLWRFEEQNAHTAALADKAAKVYAKLTGFLGTMEDIGKQLKRAHESYDTAMNQLVNGRGNLINQAKDFEKLGVAVKAQLPSHLVEKAALELDFGGVAPIEYIPGDTNPA